MKDAHKKYKNQSVQTASREKILLLLFEAAIRFTKQAIQACEANNISDRGYYIGRAYDIISELNNTLNHKISTNLGKNLEQLYMSIADQYVQANISGKVKHLEDALRILEILYNGWSQAIEKLKTERKMGESA